MKISSILKTNIQKLRTQKTKALFLILPITILMILTIVISSQVANFQKAADASIFGTIQDQSTLINLVKTVSFNQPTTQGGGGGRVSFFNSDNQYTSSDVAKIEQINNVETASINAQLPIQRAVTTDLFEGANYNLQNVVEVDSESASLYTEEDFNYEEGQVIPIILNASTFQEQYEDWGGKSEIEISFNRGSRPNGTPGANPMNDSGTPMKTRTLDFNKESLIGKTFTVNFGGLDPLTTFKVEPASGTVKFVKLTQAEIDAAAATRKTAIEKYWNYDKVSTPVSYTFKVVGVIESESDTKSYVPAKFADALMSKYVQNQIDARNTTAIPTDDLNSTYRGLTYDGTELSGGNGAMFSIAGGPGGGARPAVRIGGIGGSTNNNTDSYTIPGLVVELKSDGSQDVVGEYKDSTVYEKSVKKGQSISIKIDDVYARSQVIKDLNAAGFSYQDVSNLSVFDDLKATLATISTWLTIGFIGISIAVIIFAMSKFVSDSRKDIGIFRAIGMKKKDIIKLFTSQALLYVLVGYVIGGVLGYFFNLVSAGFMKNWFDSLVGKTVKETFNVVNEVNASVFQGISIQTIGVYSAILLVITLLISLIPAVRASSISPVEAIKGE
jgi:ABC-type antimicrobial peptide transport system permease subunit